jgi:hypothetical protein
LGKRKKKRKENRRVRERRSDEIETGKERGEKIKW